MRTPPSVRIAGLLAAGLILTAPSPAQGQGIAELFTSMRNGGGWVGIPIEKGRGSFRSAKLPVAALSIAGCVNVWYGHSGTWQIEARESVLGSVLRVTAQPGIGVPFDHDFGMQAQVDIDFRWSEPRDTTLMLWVGLDMARDGRVDPCEPDYGGSN